MNRSFYFNYIEEKLNMLSYRIHKRGKINLLDLNIYSETFFAELINLLFLYDLKNINASQQNTEGIDLIDNTQRIIVQVSATCTKQKIENSLEKDIFEKYPNYRYKFIALTGDAKNLRKTSYKNPHDVLFDPENDIYDITSLLNIVLNIEIKQQCKLYNFIKDELGSTIDIVKIDSNLATIINILSKENFAEISSSPEINSFEIQRKIDYNNLSAIQPTIDAYKIYYQKLNEKYIEFDKQGANKSLSILSIIQKEYIKLVGIKEDEQEIFFLIIQNLIKIITNSRNYIEIPFEELEMCVSILIVDAFIKCKIFKNPEGYNHVIAR